MRQAELASACDISASYLNLIEHNKRRIAGGLLVRIAKALDVEPGYLSGGAEVRLATELDAAADAHPSIAAERTRAGDLAARYPGWSRLIAQQYRENRRLEQVIGRLGDRLTHDPFLSASMHNVLTSVTAIRSASAILAGGDEIEPEWEARFHRNIFEDSQRLAEATETLVRYLDTDDDRETDGNLPQDDLDRWLASVGWRIEALEDDPQTDPEDVIRGIDGLDGSPARIVALKYLQRYAADAATLPIEQVVSCLNDGNGAPEIAYRFGVGLPLVYRRLAVLQASEVPDGEGFGLVGCDASGTLTFRKPLPGFELPRYSAACPFWPLFRALQHPMTPIVEVVSMAGRDEGRFQTDAYAEVAYPSGFNGPSVTEAWMLIRPLRGADANAFRVGTSCRICPIDDCVARREPSIFQ